MKRRLLFAAGQAYQPAMEVAGRGVGWIEPPLVIRRELPGTHRGIDLAIAGRVAEGVVVAFRGSLPPFFGGYGEDGWTVLLDWLSDGAALCVADADYAGGVHLGFAASVARLWEDLPGSPGLRSGVATLLARGRGDGRSRAHLFAAGHSKGGALANLFAMRAARAAEWQGVPVSVATIAAPRAGDARFARAYAATRIACLRYEAPGDLVPHLPPGRDTPGFARSIVGRVAPKLAQADWQHVGLRVVAPGRAAGGGHARWAGSRRMLPRLLDRRGAGLEALLPQVLRAHAICPHSAYDRLVCTGEGGCDHGLPVPLGFRLRG